MPVDKKTRRLIDFETKKSIHINLSRESHAGFKKFLFDYGLSMQEVFEYFASQVAEEDNYAVKIVMGSYKRKRDNKNSTKGNKTFPSVRTVISRTINYLLFPQNNSHNYTHDNNNTP